MDRLKKLELIKRSLGLRHKLKVHDSMKQPETHEEMAVSLISRWELEDELRAIEEILAEDRLGNVRKKRDHYVTLEPQPLSPVADPLHAHVIAPAAAAEEDKLADVDDEDEELDDAKLQARYASSKQAPVANNKKKK